MSYLVKTWYIKFNYTKSQYIVNNHNFSKFDKSEYKLSLHPNHKNIKVIKIWYINYLNTQYMSPISSKLNVTKIWTAMFTLNETPNLRQIICHENVLLW